MTDLPKREPLTALQMENEEAADRESAAIKEDMKRRMERILARIRQEKNGNHTASNQEEEEGSFVSGSDDGEGV